MGTQSAHASYEAVLTLLRVARPLAAATPTQLEAYFKYLITKHGALQGSSLRGNC
jgi:hypothetical protein